MSPISRAEVLLRARQWVTEGVPYSQSAWWKDSLGTYRQDCSGYVSMAWHLEENIDFWTGNLAVVSHPVTADQLLPGDILLSPSHTVLFAGWTDTAHTRFAMYEESHPGTTAHYTTGVSYAYYAGNGFAPYRYDLIQDSGPALATSPFTTSAAAIATPTGLAPAAAPVRIDSPLVDPSAVPQPLPLPPPIAWSGDAATLLTPDPPITAPGPVSETFPAFANTAAETDAARHVPAAPMAAPAAAPMAAAMTAGWVGLLLTACLRILWRIRFRLPPAPPLPPCLVPLPPRAPLARPRSRPAPQRDRSRPRRR